MIPREIEKLGVDVCYHVDDVLEKVDVINVLRIQLERQEGGLFPSLREYHNYFGITRARLDKLSKPITIMHPGPINRGVEISSDVADSEHSLILNQVTNGVAIRMAVLYLLAGGENINA
jgi:aspartate carbamoyltransferase catalytic subunit